jgi:uncharacterized phage protein (TIGR01671 family)
MREILFRGKRKDNGEWIEGFYVCNRYSIGFAKEPAIYENHYIYTKRIDSEKWFKTIQVEVIPETVGQFTGLTDKKNGKKIFEGDIVKICSSNWWCGYTNNQLEKESCRVYYNEKTACFKFNDGKFSLSFDEYLHHDSDKRYLLEVIGNIHDNPELLKEQQNER